MIFSATLMFIFAPQLMSLFIKDEEVIALGALVLRIQAFGEIGLAGEIRSVNSCEQRIKEAAKLGFEKCVIPYHNYSKLPKYLFNEIEIVPAKNIRQAFEAIMS